MFLLHRDLIVGLLLLPAALIAYHPAWNGKPVWDDERHITAPELSSFTGLEKIWTKLGATQQYYPLVHSVFWAEYRLWGDAPLGYHLLNILLHALSSLLLYKILRRLAIPGAWLAAAVFALHPIEVESVAWISELKNCLSGVFFFGAILCYLQFDRKRTLQPYLVSIGLFSLGLMAKTAIAPMPAAMLVILWWKRAGTGRLRWKKDFLPLLPFFLAGISFGLFTAWVERKFVIGKDAINFNYSLIERCLIAGRVFWFYLSKLFVPVNLTFVYRRWEVCRAVWWQYLFPIGAVSLISALWLLRHRSSAPAAAIGYFIVMLFPALGFFTIYPFRYSFVADHFQYLAGVGPMVLASASLSSAISRMRGRIASAARLLPVIILFTLAALTWRQCGIYADIESLYKAVIRNNPTCLMAHNNLGFVYQNTGRPDKALACYRRAIELNPTFREGYYNMGNVLMQTGRIYEAITQYRKALDGRPDYIDAQVGLGEALMQTGQVMEAIVCFRKALDIDSSSIGTLLDLGDALRKAGRNRDAADCYRRVLRMNPADLKTLNGLCDIFMRIGQPDNAILAAEKAMILAKSTGQEALAKEIAGNIEEMRRGEKEEARSR